MAAGGCPPKLKSLSRSENWPCTYTRAHTGRRWLRRRAQAGTHAQDGWVRPREAAGWRRHRVPPSRETELRTHIAHDLDGSVELQEHGLLHEHPLHLVAQRVNVGLVQGDLLGPLPSGLGSDELLDHRIHIEG